MCQINLLLFLTDAEERGKYKKYVCGNLEPYNEIQGNEHQEHVSVVPEPFVTYLPDFQHESSKSSQSYKPKIEYEPDIPCIGAFIEASPVFSCVIRVYVCSCHASITNDPCPEVVREYIVRF